MSWLIKTPLEANHVLSNGKVLIYPTETLWGLGASIENTSAIENIFKLKKRPLKQPISLLVRDIKMAQQYATLEEKIINCMKALWPGPVTFVLPALPSVPSKIHAGSNFVGLRCTSHPFMKLVMQKRNQPITTTSANISGQEPVYKLSQIQSIFENIHCVDSREVLKPPGSTVVKWKDSNLSCLREGGLPFAQILKIFQQD